MPDRLAVSRRDNAGNARGGDRAVPAARFSATKSTCISFRGLGELRGWAHRPLEKEGRLPKFGVYALWVPMKDTYQKMVAPSMSMYRLP